MAIPHQTAARNVCIAQDHAAARMFFGVSANQLEDTRVVREIAIIVIHDLHLAPVNALEAEIDVRDSQKIEP